MELSSSHSHSDAFLKDLFKKIALQVYQFRDQKDAKEPMILHEDYGLSAKRIYYVENTKISLINKCILFLWLCCFSCFFALQDPRLNLLSLGIMCTCYHAHLAQLCVLMLGFLLCKLSCFPN